jgi:hypothetical protein
MPIAELKVPTLDGNATNGGGAEGSASADTMPLAPSAPVDAGASTAPPPPSSTPILTALFPTSMAQIHAQLGPGPGHLEREVFLPVRGVQSPALQSPHVPIAAQFHTAPLASNERPAPLAPAAMQNIGGQLLPNPAILAQIAPAADEAPALPTSEVVTPKQISPVPSQPAPTLAHRAAAPVATSEANLTDTTEAGPLPAETLDDSTPQNPAGIPGAKRDAAMQDPTLKQPVTAPPANSAGEQPARVERTPAQRAAQMPVTNSAAHEGRHLTLPIAHAETRKQGDRDAASREANLPERSAIEGGPMANFSAIKPHFELPRTEPASATNADAAITRTEVTQLLERTVEAAVRLRATGTERVEVAVQLASGDQITIQLRMANGEVTPIIRTNSEALRTALEQNWTGFTERTAERGVRMTQPVFDVNSSSSNMTDLSQQRHGRDTAFTDPQGELFRHLPPRIRPPRVLAPSAVEHTATADGVRLYA